MKPKNNLEIQLENFEIIEALDNLRIIELNPEKLKTEIPIFIAHGWGVRGRIFKDVGANLAQNDRRVIIIDADHGINTEEKNDEVPEEEMRKIEAMIKVLEAKGIEKVDVVAHSEGGFNMIWQPSFIQKNFEI